MDRKSNKTFHVQFFFIMPFMR